MMHRKRNSNKERRWIESIKNWAIELLVVFVGVYAAFWLSEFKAEQQEEKQRGQIIEALVNEIEGILVRTRRASENMPQMVAYFDSTIALGLMPELQPLIEPIRAESHMWEATLQMGGLNVMDPPTMYQISEFYNALNGGFEQLSQLRNLSETVLIPNMEKGSEEFYDPNTKELRSKYEWYMQGLKRVADLAQAITYLGDQLVLELKNEEEGMDHAGS